VKHNNWKFSIFFLLAICVTRVFAENRKDLLVANNLPEYFSIRLLSSPAVFAGIRIGRLHTALQHISGSVGNHRIARTSLAAVGVQ